MATSGFEHPRARGKRPSLRDGSSQGLAALLKYRRTAKAYVQTWSGALDIADHLLLFYKSIRWHVRLIAFVSCHIFRSVNLTMSDLQLAGRPCGLALNVLLVRLRFGFVPVAETKGRVFPCHAALFQLSSLRIFRRQVWIVFFRAED